MLTSSHLTKGRYVFRTDTPFGPWSSPAREVALFSLKTTCGLGPFDRCTAICRTDCTGVKLRDIAPDATLASDTDLLNWDVPTLAQQVAICRATRKLHGASLGELCKRLLTNPAEAAEKIMTTSMYAPFDTPIEDVLLPQARLRASRCALSHAALRASGTLPLTFITTSADASKAYTRLELEDGQIGPCAPGTNLLGQVWEEIRNGGIEMLKEPFHVVCTSAEMPFFEHSSAVVHVAEDLLQKTRFFENNRFSSSCMATLVTLSTVESTSGGNEELFQQLLAAIKNAPHVQAVVTPPPPIQTDAYIGQAKKLMTSFPGLYGMTDSGGSLLQVSEIKPLTHKSCNFPIGRYGSHADRRYVNGDKWEKDGILALKAHLVQVMGHHWLRNTPKATATFPLRQLHQMQLGSSGQAPVSQPSTSRRSNDANLHSTRGGRINRHIATPRSGPRSTPTIDPQLLTNIISALQPSSHAPKPHRQQKRK